MFRQTISWLCCFALLGCQTPRMKFYDDRAAMEQQVAALVPAGTPLTGGKKTMKDNGFDCVESRESKRQDGTEGERGEPHLLCKYTQMTGIFGNYALDVKFPCSEDGCVGEAGVDKLTATRGLA